MTGYAGSALYMEWVTASGTTVLSTDFRSVNINRTFDIIDATAGADTYREKLPSFRDVEVTFSGVLQSGTASGQGTAMIAALTTTVLGTLNIGYEGTASNKPKFSLPCYSQGPSINQPFDDIVEITNTWIANAAPTETNW